MFLVYRDWLVVYNNYEKYIVDFIFLIEIYSVFKL